MTDNCCDEKCENCDCNDDAAMEEEMERRDLVAEEAFIPVKELMQVVLNDFSFDHQEEEIKDNKRQRVVEEYRYYKEYFFRGDGYADLLDEDGFKNKQLLTFLKVYTIYQDNTQLDYTNLGEPANFLEFARLILMELATKERDEYNIEGRLKGRLKSFDESLTKSRIYAALYLNGYREEIHEAIERLSEFLGVMNQAFYGKEDYIKWWSSFDENIKSEVMIREED